GNARHLRARVRPRREGHRGVRRRPAQGGLDLGHGRAQPGDDGVRQEITSRTRKRCTRGACDLPRRPAGASLATVTGMRPIEQAAADFLAKKRIAVTGVSRKPESHGANVVYKRLRERGWQVFAVNPNAESVEGDPSYHDLSAIPGGVEAVV